MRWFSKPAFSAMAEGSLREILRETSGAAPVLRLWRLLRREGGDRGGYGRRGEEPRPAGTTMAAIRHRTHTRRPNAGSERGGFVLWSSPPLPGGSSERNQDGCSSTLDITAIRHRDVELELKVLGFFEVFWESREWI